MKLFMIIIFKWKIAELAWSENLVKISRRTQGSVKKISEYSVKCSEICLVYFLNISENSEVLKNVPIFVKRTKTAPSFL